jgi:hypothetical protein
MAIYVVFEKNQEPYKVDQVEEKLLCLKQGWIYWGGGFMISKKILETK